VCSSDLASADAGRPSQLLAVFIHRVVPPASTLSKLRSAKCTKDDLLEAWKDRGIYFYRSHVGMAKKCLELGLLDAEALHQVMASAVTDFRRVWCRYGGRHAGRNLGKAVRHLNKDLAASNAMLPSYLKVPLVEATMAEEAAEKGDGTLPRREMSVTLSEATNLVPMN